MKKVLEIYRHTKKIERDFEKIKDELLVECQKYCDFELKSCEYYMADGFCFTFSSESFEEDSVSVDSFFNLILKKKRNLTIKDLYAKF